MESENKQTQSIEALQNFINTSLETKLWQACETNLETKVLNLYRNVINNVPAYGAFLAENNINPESIKTLQDFQSLPLLTKKNYIHKYPLPDLCRQGTLESCDFIAVSSGSTGNPTFWT
ncbi:MAG: phenylacetate--CoA ligase family protein, partial [Cyanobacteria bacterium P01_G01_bin.19]